MRYLAILPLLIMSGCASVALDSSHNDCWDTVVCQQGPVIEPSAAEQLVSLPYPNRKTVVAVYSFPDETGQRKPS